MFLWSLTYSTQGKLQTPYFSNDSLPSFITFSHCMSPMHLLPRSNSLQSPILFILHLLSFVFPTCTHPSSLLKGGISHFPVFPFYKNRTDLCSKCIYGYVPQNRTQQSWNKTLCRQPEITRIREDTDITCVTNFAHFHLAVSLKGHSLGKRYADGRSCCASDESQFWYYTADRE